jgi:hypothetical protein
VTETAKTGKKVAGTFKRWLALSRKSASHLFRVPATISGRYSATLTYHNGTV